ncbi:MAG: hypothetical protein IPO21_08570 [Bacteroidales bacterium]|nr:hypothetical protein [Bacteroidales bacterium]
MIEEIGIIEVRKIVSTLLERYEIDLQDYSMTSLKRRFILSMLENKVKNVDELVNKIISNPQFFEKFMFDISINDTEMFRDPSLWRVIRNEIIPKVEAQLTFKIWMPDCGSGEELYSLLIILKEEGILDKVKVYASNLSRKKIEFIKEGVYEIKRDDVNSANYERAKCNNDFSEYYTLVNNRMKMDTSLVDNVEFIHTNSIFKKSPEGVKLIIFRNHLIYLNKTLQNKVIEHLQSILLTGGFLIIGVKELLNTIDAERKFKVINDSERVYQKNLY